MQGWEWRVWLSELAGKTSSKSIAKLAFRKTRNYHTSQNPLVICVPIIYQWNFNIISPSGANMCNFAAAAALPCIRTSGETAVLLTTRERSKAELLMIEHDEFGGVIC